MAVNKYLTAAAGQLESAANALKMEMDQARADFLSFEQQTTRAIDSKENDIRALTAQAATMANAAEGHHLIFQIKQLKNDVERMKGEISQRRSRLDGELKGKEGAMNGLMSQARGLYSQAGNFK